MNFHGCLTFLDVPSDRCPHGSLGHKIVMTSRVAEQALPSLIGCELNFRRSLDGHSSDLKGGTITRALIANGRLEVFGWLHAEEIAEAISRVELGLSYEIKNAVMEDMRQPIWTIARFSGFVGAAIVLRKKAAYSNTWIRPAEIEVE